MLNFIQKTVKARFVLTEEMLGMMPGDPKIHEQFIASKSPDALTLEEELEYASVDEVIDKSKTVFPKDENGVPFLWDYQFRGFLKDSIGMLRKMPGSEAAKIKAYKRVIDGNVFIVDDTPDHNPVRRLTIHTAGEIGDCQRPLRAETAQGPRVALANSETVPGESWFEVTIGLLDPSLEKVVKECCEYARYHGFGQWRNSGKGTATVEFLG